jgi:hypothetical protein
MILNNTQKDKIKELKLKDSKCEYKSNKWEKLNEDFKPLIEDFKNKEITREDVINAYKDYFADNKNAYMKPFLLTMIWGFGDTGYGTYRTNNYISDKEKIKNALDLINNNNADCLEKAFAELKNIKGLGISYLTKILYFATKAKGFEKYAIIFDIRVARALIKLTAPEVYELVSVSPSSKFEHYKRFITIIHDIAEQNDVQADQLELYLFDSI